MKILFTIVLGFGVLIAALVCLSSSMCAVENGDVTTRTLGVAVALISLGIAVGGAMLIAKINRKD
jgi:hypothetical protein